ncbi:hypothetical protein M0R45_024885 [Rubus argutus]|uniref:Uncharacterized protein n=1 Tax=Rubus argutus TaxID=59490 RepID=A0AAW1WUM2_RUBAR
MPTKRVPCWKDKPVFVSVYVERPASTTRHHHHHHHHHRHFHHTIKQEVIHRGDGAGGKGYTTSRIAELLQYSQRLRQSARTAPPSIRPVPNPNHTSNPQTQAEIVAVPRKPKNAKAPNCFGNCNLPTIFGPLTSFHAKKERKTRTKSSGHANNKIKAAIKSLKVEKQQDFFIKLFSASAKRK